MRANRRIVALAATLASIGIAPPAHAAGFTALAPPFAGHFGFSECNLLIVTGGICTDQEFAFDDATGAGRVRVADAGVTTSGFSRVTTAVFHEIAEPATAITYRVSLRILDAATTADLLGSDLVEFRFAFTHPSASFEQTVTIVPSGTTIEHESRTLQFTVLPTDGLTEIAPGRAMLEAEVTTRIANLPPDEVSSSEIGFAIKRLAFRAL